METTTSNPIPADRTTALPYPPSLHDRLMQAVKRLPLPYGLTYLLLFLLNVLINYVVDWISGSTTAFHFPLIVCFYPLLIWGTLAIMTWLDDTARKALHRFSPLLDIHPETLQRLEYEFTTMPPRGLVFRTILWTSLYVIFLASVYFPVVVPRLHSAPPTVAYSLVEGFFAFNCGLFYHTTRQLSLVNRTVKLVKHFDLFRLDSVYAFSHFTARTGAALLLLASLILVVVPFQLSPAPLLAFQITGIVSALTAFALPLWVVHERLDREKRSMVAAHDERIKSTLARLHHALDQDQLGNVSQLNDVLDGLDKEGGILGKIRTWPWSTGTLTGFLSAIVLPIVLFFAQLAIQKWLGG
jgi:hypothetical protein